MGIDSRALKQGCRNINLRWPVDIPASLLEGSRINPHHFAASLQDWAARAIRGREPEVRRIDLLPILQVMTLAPFCSTHLEWPLLVDGSVVQTFSLKILQKPSSLTMGSEVKQAPIIYGPAGG